MKAVCHNGNILSKKSKANIALSLLDKTPKLGSWVYYPNEINSMHQEFHTYIFYLEVSLLVEIYYTISCNIKKKKKFFTCTFQAPIWSGVELGPDNFFC